MELVVMKFFGGAYAAMMVVVMTTMIIMIKVVTSAQVCRLLKKWVHKRWFARFNPHLVSAAGSVYL